MTLSHGATFQIINSTCLYDNIRMVMCLVNKECPLGDASPSRVMMEDTAAPRLKWRCCIKYMMRLVFQVFAPRSFQATDMVWGTWLKYNR